GALRAPDRDLQTLAAGATDGNDEPTARLQLFVERLREVGCRGGDGDSVERREFRQAQRPVADVDQDAAVPRLCQPLSRRLGELRDPLDRVYLIRELRKHRRLVAGARAD